MDTTPIQTPRLNLVPQTLEQVRAMVEAMPPHEKAELSADWLARLAAATEADPWMHFFSVVLRDSNVDVGKAGFKGPPADGVVEIAYGIDLGLQTVTVDPFARSDFRYHLGSLDVSYSQDAVTMMSRPLNFITMPSLSG